MAQGRGWRWPALVEQMIMMKDGGGVVRRRQYRLITRDSVDDGSDDYGSSCGFGRSDVAGLTWFPL